MQNEVKKGREESSSRERQTSHVRIMLQADPALVSLMRNKMC